MPPTLTERVNALEKGAFSAEEKQTLLTDVALIKTGLFNHLKHHWAITLTLIGGLVTAMAYIISRTLV